MNSTYDIAIVGAGPAGSSLAIRLAQAGKRVLLVEKDKFPRQKLCGEFISPECLSHFAELGVIAQMSDGGGVELTETVFYSRSGRGVVVPSSMFGSLHRHALGLSRAEMDLRLMQRAAGTGVEVRERTLASLVTNGARATGLLLKEAGQTSSTPAEIGAALVVDASGRGRAMSRNLVASSFGKAKLVAFKTHATGVDLPTGRCEIFSYRGGYGGTNRVEGGFHNLCFIASAADVRRLGSNAESVFRETVCSNERAKRVFRDVRFENEWLAVPIDRFGRGELVPLPGLLAIGDAASFIDPFTGSGMLLALESARLAAECVLEAGDVALEYQKRYSAIFDRRLKVCSWIRRVSLVPFMTEATVLALNLSTGFRNRLVAATRQTVAEPDEVIR